MHFLQSLQTNSPGEESFVMSQRAKEIYINGTNQVEEEAIFFLAIAETAIDQICVLRSIQLPDESCQAAPPKSRVSTQAVNTQNTQLTVTLPSVRTDGQTDGSTCEEDEVPLLCVLSLEFDQTLQVRGLT